MRYQIIEAQKRDFGEALREVADYVESNCVDGWRPLGGISVAYDGTFYCVCQAMVKERK